MSNFKFDSLLKERNLKYKDKWAPVGVEDYFKLIKRGILKDMNKELCSNIVYNLQYLEYIDFQLKELRLHSMIEVGLYKTFIITTISIIEVIFYYILKSNNKYRTTNKDLILKTTSNKTKYNNDEVVVETHLYKIIESKEIEMPFGAMIKKIETGKYLDLKHEYFPYLKHFRDLRNLIHLHITDNNKYGTDFWKFDRVDFLFVKHMLLKLLTDEKIQETKDKELSSGEKIPKEYKFLELSVSEKKIVSQKYKCKYQN